ncbi:hypothetical protein G1C97_0507 [Bifidobacterium sp. DSM 109959]|uniref:Uncharacterized protein n=1 Tax=Bifidobacterium olomucense TaxID=2675324 RepID=A0A7Y0EWX1_9BIFI|nr:hypothetical protein [Bifidobacterium sp. DSM 109959]
MNGRSRVSEQQADQAGRTAGPHESGTTLRPRRTPRGGATRRGDGTKGSRAGAPPTDRQRARFTRTEEARRRQRPTRVVLIVGGSGTGGLGLTRTSRTTRVASVLLLVCCACGGALRAWFASLLVPPCWRRFRTTRVASVLLLVGVLCGSGRGSLLFLMDCVSCLLVAVRSACLVSVVVGEWWWFLGSGCARE